MKSGPLGEITIAIWIIAAMQCIQADLYYSGLGMLAMAVLSLIDWARK